ncbi:hypothetical protein [Bacillus manliponensis]|uniref:phage tail assembly chaperone n=1 Tax=Bacillus manliponensis TaxID=574376 RepID=UPI0035140E60
MSDIKKLTVTDLLKDKEKYQVKDDVTDDLLINRLGMSITIRKPERSLCLESYQMGQDPKLTDKADEYLVYNIVVEPNLKDAQLQKAYGCVEPMDIVHKIFEPGEITSIAQSGLDLAGYAQRLSSVKDLKN